MPKWGCSNRGGQLPDGAPRLLGHRQDVAHLARHVLQVVSKVIWHTHMAITLSMSSSPANCDMMRGSRCIPLLVQLLHLDPAHPANPRPSRPVRARAARSLHNIVHAHPTDKHCKREAKVLKLLEVLRQYSDFLRDVLEAVRSTFLL